MPSSLLAGITVVAPDRACVLVELAVDVAAHRMIAQIEIGGVQSWVPTPENQRHVMTVFKIIVSSCRFKGSGVYSAGGRQQPDSMGVRSASLYCFRVCMH